MTARVAVIGAGPAGCSTAIHLREAGHEVTLMDKASFPRDKTCGDGLTTAALRHLERLGFDPATVPSWTVVNNTIWRSPSGYTIELPVPRQNGIRIAVARRHEFDAALVSMARAAGAIVHEGSAVTGVEVGSEPGDQITVTATANDPVTCDYVIGADGMWSPLRHLVAPRTEQYLGDIHAFRQYFSGVTGSGRDSLWVSFEPDLIPGYVWSFPVGDGAANIGFGIARKPGQSVRWMKDAWPRILERPHIQEMLGNTAKAEEPHKAWPIPSRINLQLLSALGGRALFVGDAARVVDPLTGEGIAQAMETGELAAKAIHRAGAVHPELAARHYRRAIQFGMALDNGFARMLAQLVSHEAAARAVIRLAPHGPWRGRYAVKWAFEDNPRAALLTPWRWRSRFAAKDGALL